MRIVTKRDLMEALKHCNDNDQIVIDLEEDLYEFSVDVVPNIQMADGSKINEIRLVPYNWAYA